MASSAVAVDRHEQEQEASIDANVSILSGTTVVIDNLVEGARVRKHKGEINGDSIHIKDCSDSHIYLFDVSSDVEITGCRHTEVYVIGLVDGPVLVTDCVGCKVVVASQQFQAKRCHDCCFGIHSVTGPTLSESTGIRISPWSGDGLEVRLDPSSNQFLNVYDASESRRDPNEPIQDHPRNFVVCFEPVQVRVLDVRKRGDSSTEETLMVFSETIECKTESESECRAGDVGGEGVAGGDAGPCSSSRPEERADASGSIKAIKMCEDTTWKKTLDLIDIDNGSQHLARFKSVLLSMTTGGKPGPMASVELGRDTVGGARP